jgi:DNA repair protein RecO (recombination protein O)
VSDETLQLPTNERSRLYSVEGVVLRRRDLGEADRILTVFTDRVGKVSVVAKGVRRTKSRLAGHLEPFCRSSLLIAKGRNLDIVTQASLIEPYRNLHQNETLIAYAGYFADLLDLFSVEGQENHRVYELYIDTLDHLDQGVDPFVTSVIFEFRLLDLMGFKPELHKCIDCGRDLEPETNGFSLSGGVLCPECRSNQPLTETISLNALKFLRLIERGNLETARRLRLSTELSSEIDRTIRGYVGFVLEREPRSLTVLRTLVD